MNLRVVLVVQIFFKNLRLVLVVQIFFKNLRLSALFIPDSHQGSAGRGLPGLGIGRGEDFRGRQSFNFHRTPENEDVQDGDRDGGRLRTTVFKIFIERPRTRTARFKYNGQDEDRRTNMPARTRTSEDLNFRKFLKSGRRFSEISKSRF